MTSKIAVITGAASGLGRQIALKFAQQGMSIVVADVADKEGYKTVELIQNEINARGQSSTDESRAVFVHCDVTQREDLIKAISAAKTQFGRELDVMVNNAGIGIMPEIEPNSDKWKKIININLTACIEGTILAAEQMVASGRGGVIVNVASMAGLEPQASTPVYSAAKSGVIHFTRSIAPVYVPNNVRVCALAPSFADTPLFRGLGTAVVDLVSQQWGVMTPDYVAEACLEVVLDSKNKGTGAILRVTNRGNSYWPPAPRAKL